VRAINGWQNEDKIWIRHPHFDQAGEAEEEKIAQE